MCSASPSLRLLFMSSRTKCTSLTNFRPENFDSTECQNELAKIVNFIESIPVLSVVVVDVATKELSRAAANKQSMKHQVDLFIRDLVHELVAQLEHSGNKQEKIQRIVAAKAQLLQRFT